MESKAIEKVIAWLRDKIPPKVWAAVVVVTVALGGGYILGVNHSDPDQPPPPPPTTSPPPLTELGGIGIQSYCQSRHFLRGSLDETNSGPPLVSCYTPMPSSGEVDTGVENRKDIPQVSLNSACEWEHRNQGKLAFELQEEALISGLCFNARGTSVGDISQMGTYCSRMYEPVFSDGNGVREYQENGKNWACGLSVPAVKACEGSYPNANHVDVTYVKGRLTCHGCRQQ